MLTCEDHGKGKPDGWRREEEQKQAGRGGLRADLVSQRSCPFHTRGAGAAGVAGVCEDVRDALALALQRWTGVWVLAARGGV